MSGFLDIICQYILCVIIACFPNCGKFLKRWECQATLSASWEICIQVKKQQLELDMEYQTTWPASWETCMQVKKQQLELDMEEQTGSK